MLSAMVKLLTAILAALQPPLRAVTVSRAVAAAGDYAAGDVVSNSVTAGTASAWKLPNLAPAEGVPFWITRVTMTCSAEMTAMTPRMHLFRREPTASELRDNVALSLLEPENLNYLGVIDGFGVFADRGDFSASETNDVRKRVTPAEGSRDLWFILETTTAETNEVAGMTMRIEVEVSL